MYCSTCGFELPKSSKFCPKCGASVVFNENTQLASQIKETKKPIEQVNHKQLESTKKHIINCFGLVELTGWVSLGFATIGYIWTLLDTSTTPFNVQLGGLIGNAGVDIALIILARRIVKLNDIYIRRYLYAASILLFLLTAWIFIMGGKFGFLIAVVVLYCFASLFNIETLFKNEGFRKSLNRQKYILKDWGWFWYVAIWLLLVMSITMYQYQTGG